MPFANGTSRRLILTTLLAVVVAVPYAIPVPWLALSRWMTGRVIENPDFLPQPVDNQTWFVIFFACVAAMACAVFWKPEKPFQLRSLINPVTCAAAAWFVVTLLRGVLADHFQSAYHELLLQWAFLLLFLTAATHRTSARHLVFVQAALAVGIIPLAVIALMQNFGADPLPYSAVVKGTLENVTGKNLIASTFGHPNYMGSYFAPVIVLCLGLVFSRNAWPLRALGAGAAIVAVPALMAGGTRGPLLAVIGGAAVFFLLYRGWRAFTKRQLWIAVGVAAGCVLLGWWLVLPGLARHFNLADRLLASKEVASRAFYWVVGLEMFKTAPVFGIGAGQFDNHFWQTLDRMPEIEPGGPWHFMVYSIVRGVRPGYMHNDHLQVLVESGLIGMFAWACLWAGIVCRSLSLRRICPLGSGASTLNAAMAGSFAAVFIDALFGFPFHLPCSGALFWVLLGLWAGWHTKYMKPEAMSGLEES